MNHVRAHVLSAIPALRCSMERAQAEASGPGGRTGGDTTGTSVTDRRAREVRARRAEASGPGGRTGGDKTGTSVADRRAREVRARRAQAEASGPEGRYRQRSAAGIAPGTTRADTAAQYGSTRAS